jgi:hypothetical protein
VSEGPQTVALTPSPDAADVGGAPASATVIIGPDR